MKICIGNRDGRWTGRTGKAKFAIRLMDAMRDKGIELTTDRNEKVDIDLQFSKWSYIPKNAKRKILRCGPVHIDSSKNCKKLNSYKLEAAKRSDGIIWQSKWSRQIFGAVIEKIDKPSRVILNGASIERYNSIEPYIVNNKINILASTRKWYPQKRLKHILRSITSMRRKDIVLWVCGEVEDKLLKKYRNLSNIKFLGCVKQDYTLARVYKMCDVMVHIVYLDACPNSVAEAQCAGIPVVHTDQGGTKELVKHGVCIQDKPHDFDITNLYKVPKVRLRSLNDAINACIKMPKKVNEEIDIQNIAEQYIAYFRDILNG